MSMTLEYNDKSTVIAMLVNGVTSTNEVDRRLPSPVISVYSAAHALIEIETGYSTVESLQCLKDIVTGNKQLEAGFAEYLASRVVKPAESAAQFAAAFSDFTL